MDREREQWKQLWKKIENVSVQKLDEIASGV